MENKEQDHALQAKSEANRETPVNYEEKQKDINDDAKNKEGEESRRQKHDADSGNEGLNEMLQKEKLIDPGNEHHHDTGAEDKIFNSDLDRSPPHDADHGGDTSGTVDPEPAEG